MKDIREACRWTLAFLEFELLVVMAIGTHFSPSLDPISIGGEAIDHG